MNITTLKRNWDDFGRIDSLRAILVGQPEGGWTEEAFFQTGRADIEAAFDELRAIHLLPRGGRALDFGCGVGRLTQALSDKFEQVVGVDISPAMIEAAIRYNRTDRCTFLMNDRPDLSVFPDSSFDFVYTLIVLQHMKPTYARRYLTEFLRVAKDGGLVVFQIPARLKSPRGAALPPPAFRARLELATVPHELQPVQRWSAAVTLTNVSDVAWPAIPNDGPGRLALGNHWLDASDRIVVLDDGRAPIARQLLPGESLRLTLDVTAPAVPGDYVLELDVVQEGVAWFGKRGSSTFRCPVRVAQARPSTGLSLTPMSDVSEAPRPANRSAPLAAPKMEMYCVPRQDVERLIAASGGQVVEVREHHGSGPSFESYQYFVVKRGMRSRWRLAAERVRWPLGQLRLFHRRVWAKLATLPHVLLARLR